MPRLGGYYMTDDGPVRLSEREAEVVQLRLEMNRFGTADDPRFERFRTRADALISDIHRVAEHKRMSTSIPCSAMLSQQR